MLLVHGLFYRPCVLGAVDASLGACGRRASVRGAGCATPLVLARPRVFWHGRCTNAIWSRKLSYRTFSIDRQWHRAARLGRLGGKCSRIQHIAARCDSCTLCGRYSALGARQCRGGGRQGRCMAQQQRDSGIPILAAGPRPKGRGVFLQFLRVRGPWCRLIV